MRFAKFALVALPILAQQATEPTITLVGTITTPAETYSPFRRNVSPMRSIDRGCFLVAPARNTKSTHRKQVTRVVCYSPETVFSTTSKDLKPGQEIYIVGVEVKNGNINATRVTIYNTDIPVQ